MDVVEEFAPNPPPPQADPQAFWMGLVLVAVAVLGGVVVYFGLIRQTGPRRVYRYASGKPSTSVTTVT